MVSGLGQIEQSLTQVDIPLQYPQLSVFDRLFWSGRRRELLAARWLVRRLLPPIQSEVKFEPIANVSPPAVNLPVAIPTTSLTVASVLDNSLAKIQLGGENNTNYVLEIDILNAEKRRELLYIVFTQIRQIVNDLSLLNLDYQNFLDKIPVIIQKLWENSTRFFLEIYYPDKQKIRDGLIDEIILTNTLGVQQEILSKIPFLQELFAHIIYEMPVRVDNIEYNSQSPEAINRSEILLQNLIIQVSNAVVGLILNNFTEIEELTNTIYDRQLRSYREIARFRNTLSWQYRQLQYWEEPKAIFESKYRLFYLTERKIQQTFIEFPRQQELRQLKGIRWLVTIILEGRDAIAPRLRSVIALVGQGLVYVLTQVIGRGIGLIGRGIIQGVGRSIQK